MGKSRKELIAWLKDEIKSLMAEMCRKENADDFYYTRGSYQDDKKHLEALNRELSDLERSDNVIYHRFGR